MKAIIKTIIILLSFVQCGLLLNKNAEDAKKNTLFGVMGIALSSQSPTVSTTITNSSSTSLVLQYGSGSYTFTKNLALTLTPVLSSPASSCVASPSLPTGLSINSLNCVIAGTPTTIQNLVSYTITGTASTGTSTATISIEIKDSPPNNLTYTSTNWMFNVNSPLTIIVPTVTGTVTNCTVLPSLPNGITLDNTNCSITGTPLSIKPLTTYIITASNPYGNTTATLYLTVLPQALSNLSYTGNPFSFTQNLAISGLNPTITGTPTSCSSNPTLPAGLLINPATCAITGMPTGLQQFPLPSKYQ